MKKGVQSDTEVLSRENKKTSAQHLRNNFSTIVQQ
jgi:hypothetical protein